jgi:hypothetical protein
LFGTREVKQSAGAQREDRRQQSNLKHSRLKLAFLQRGQSELMGLAVVLLKRFFVKRLVQQ